jgi:glycosyltransferase EpsJ
MNFMPEIDISVVVPIYNAEKYLPRCLDSIINQAYKNIEIIIVDDGSIDSSKDIIKDYVLKDDRIKVIHKQNGGVSSARNKGIEAANGKYIAFVDADDYILPNMYSSMINVTMDNDIDLCYCGFVQQTLKQTKCIKLPDTDKTVFNETDIRDMLICGLAHNRLMRSLVNKLYRKVIIVDNNMRLSEAVEYGEDYLFNIEYLMHVKRVFYLNECLYYYDNTTPGATNLGSSNLLASGRLIYDKLSSCSEKWGISSERFLADSLAEYIFFARTQLKMILNSKDLNTVSKQYAKAKEIVSDKDFCQALTNNRYITFKLFLSKNFTSKFIILAAIFHCPRILLTKIWLNQISSSISGRNQPSRQN